MDFVFRCNSTECRAPLHDVAIVTTCSHIFCSSCGDALQSSKRSASGRFGRFCPACDTHLENPRDVVLTDLKPTDDYKSSILSGLTPSTIMECAGRALHFYAYQVSQEIVYQEYIGKSIADKYSNLSSHLDKIITDANTEVVNLRGKLSNFEHDKKALHSKFTALRSDYDNKCRALHRLQKEYDALRGRLSISDSKAAAAKAVDKSIRLQEDRHPNRQIGTPLSLGDTGAVDNTAQYRAPVDSNYSSWNGGVENLYRQSSVLSAMRYPRSIDSRSHASPLPPFAQTERSRNHEIGSYRSCRPPNPRSLQHGR